jgi:hypothetical protein
MQSGVDGEADDREDADQVEADTRMRQRQAVHEVRRADEQRAKDQGDERTPREAQLGGEP